MHVCMCLSFVVVYVICKIHKHISSFALVLLYKYVKKYIFVVVFHSFLHIVLFLRLFCNIKAGFTILLFCSIYLVFIFLLQVVFLFFFCYCWGVERILGCCCIFKCIKVIVFKQTGFLH